MSDDFEVLEIYSPAIHDTISVKEMPEAADWPDGPSVREAWVGAQAPGLMRD